VLSRATKEAPANRSAKRRGASDSGEAAAPLPGEDDDGEGKQEGGKDKEKKLKVIDTRTMVEDDMSTLTFFKAYSRGYFEGEQESTLLKLKDYPPTKHFSEVLPRHSQVRLPRPAPASH
jgi:hypothetical protein